MGKSKDELPENWFKRISRTRHRGMEYFFNSITKERSWTHPLKKVARQGVAEWLNHQHKTESIDDDNNSPVTDNSLSSFECIESTDDKNLPVTCHLPSSVESQRPNDSTALFSSHLEAEYERFKEALAIIEKDVAIIESSTGYTSCEDNGSSSTNSYDPNFDTESITFADEQAIREVSRLRHNDKELLMVQRSFRLVIDANIFLTQLPFLENLFHRIGEVIPYVVLQELDELKFRNKKLTSVQAMHAIAFISYQLKTMPNHVCGQSVIDNGIQLIEIFSANDSIINCCLQFRHNLEHVVLLTNDLSLSNKAMCLQIEVYNTCELDAILLNCKKDL